MCVVNPEGCFSFLVQRNKLRASDIGRYSATKPQPQPRKKFFEWLYFLKIVINKNIHVSSFLYLDSLKSFSVLTRNKYMWFFFPPSLQVCIHPEVVSTCGAHLFSCQLSFWLLERIELNF